MTDDSPTLHIQPVAQASDEVVDFLLRARLETFPGRADPDFVPPDLQHFAATYVQGAGQAWVARDADGMLLGSIAYRPYDHRFPHLDYQAYHVVEVVRLFVLPAFRRAGMAGALYAALREQAQVQGIDMLYLHTHPFLPGAIRFWEKQGFAVTAIDDDPTWQTTHMQCALPQPT